MVSPRDEESKPSETTRKNPVPKYRCHGVAESRAKHLKPDETTKLDHTVRLRGMGTGISEASKRVPIFSFATQGGKQVTSSLSSSVKQYFMWDTLAHSLSS
jgi:hypothetical protein